ncbi:dipeptide ABC transporter ATP-binding protein [Dongia deserti]|uniref:dipeptide ABC transporter ATP-binding protein n=1 Tax=Dongia deserti TaxID=2268030 RepID=UPI000E64E91C|nr:ABC transporter ATP-binding protein [Dongia deserti]
MTDTVQLLVVRNLTVAYRQGGGWARAVDQVSFSVQPGEVFGLVGESGCGKSTVSLQLLGYRHPSTKVEQGDVLFKGRSLVTMSRPELDRLRGDRIAFVPQNPTTALNPGIRIGDQLVETMVAHGRAEQVKGAAIAEVLKLVGLPADPGFQRRYPHQLSGGQQQRVCIAMALACDPDLLVLDEPTTGLDVTTQEQIVNLLSDLRRRIGVAMLYVTHDLALLSQIADRIGVMYAGRMVEIAPTHEIFLRPRHPYTQGLIASIPLIEEQSARRSRPLRGLLRRRELPAGCPFTPRCDHARDRCASERQELEAIDNGRAVACWRWREIAPIPAETSVASTGGRQSGPVPALSVDGVSVLYGPRGRGFRAVGDVSFDIKEGEVFALVGESGSGKSTLARVISGLVAPADGTIRLRGDQMAASVGGRSRDERRLIQYIFQNPDASLNPRARIGETIARPLAHFFGMDAARAKAALADALHDVRLDASYQDRYPDQLSGGERQRVAIARALVAKPALLLCDEILSALDVSVQASILALLQQLKSEHGIAMLFISHDLAVVRMLADRVCVLYGGEVMEIGAREAVFAPPYHPYTYSLLHAVPVPLRRPDKPAKSRGLVEPKRGGVGCVYAGRCPWQIEGVCETERPPWREAPGGIRLRCHLTLEELSARAGWTAAQDKEIAV